MNVAGRGRAQLADAKPRRRSRLRKQSAQALLDRLEAVRRAFLYRMPFANGEGLHSGAEALQKEISLLLVRFPSGGFASLSAKMPGRSCPAFHMDSRELGISFYD